MREMLAREDSLEQNQNCEKGGKKKRVPIIKKKS